jgi:hypothetical protein
MRKAKGKVQKAKEKEDESHAGFHPPFDFTSCLLPSAKRLVLNSRLDSNALSDTNDGGTQTLA